MHLGLLVTPLTSRKNPNFTATASPDPNSQRPLDSGHPPLRDRAPRRYRRSIDRVASSAYAAIKTGNIELTGATDALLVRTPQELRIHSQSTVPQIRLTAATSRATKRRCRSRRRRW